MISNSSPARLPIDLVDPAEAQHVDDQHRMVEVARRLVAGLLDRLGEGQAVGQAGQAVAQHFGAQIVLGLDLDGPVDHAEQAARLALRAARERRQLELQEMARGDPLALAQVELVGGVDVGQEMVSSRRSAPLQAAA